MSMTLEQVRDWHRAREASFANSKSKLFSKEDARAKRKHRQMADAIDAHLTQPAQSVDVEKVREVIAELQFDAPKRPSAYYLANKLTAALQDPDRG